MRPMHHPADCSCYPCRGHKARETRLLHVSQAAVAAVERTYSNAEKQKVRAVLMRAVERLGGPVLDLWGGGESARQLARAFPGVSVTAADNERSFRRALEHDASTHGYVAHMGDVARIAGTFAVINLDTCNGISVACRLAEQMVSHLVPGGLMLVTVMGTDRHDAYSVRSAGFAAELSAVTDLQAVCVFRYRMLSGVPAFVVGLSPLASDRAPRPTVIHHNVERDGFYANPHWSYLTARGPGTEWARRLSRNRQRQQSGRPIGERVCALPECSNVIGVDERSDRKYCNRRHTHTARSRASSARRTARRIAGLGCKQCGAPIAPGHRRVFCSEECSATYSAAVRVSRYIREQRALHPEYRRRQRLAARQVAA